MYEELASDSAVKGTFSTFDTPGGEVVYDNGEFAKGITKTFKGQRGGRYPKDTFPPPLNPVYISTQTYTSTPFKASITAPRWGTREYEGDLGALVAGEVKVRDLLPARHTIDVEQRDFSLQKAYANVEAGDFNSQLFLAELGETISMLSNPLAGLYKIHAKYRKSRKKIKNLLTSSTNATADMYLQYMFGVAPLISEVQSAYATAMEQSTARNQLFGRGSVKKSHKETKYDFLPNSFGFHVVEAWSSAKSETAMTSKVYYNLGFQSALYDLVRKWGLNPLSVPVTMWEKFPLSFVVDWFFGIKVWLNAMKPKPGVNYLGNCVSEKLVETFQVDQMRCFVRPGTPPTTLECFIPKAPWTLISERLIREVNLPVPVAIFKGAGLDSLGKSVSSTMLLIQKLKL